MGWIWLKGIKTTKPAKTASLTLNTQVKAWGELLREGSQERRAGVRAWRALPSTAHFWNCWGRPAKGRTFVHLLPFPGPFSQDPHPQLGLQHGRAWLAAPAGPRKWPLGPSHPDAHLPLPGVLATWGWFRECPRPVGSKPGGVT